MTIHGDGTQSRDFSYISNVVHANLLAARAEGVGGEVFNIACGSSLSLNEVVAEIRRLLGREGDIRYGAARSGDVPHSLAAIDKARGGLGYEPKVLALEGLRRVVEWYRKEG